MFNAKLYGKVDIAKINRPIQLMAFFTAVVVISFITGGILFSSTQTVLSYICVISAIGFTAVILFLFYKVLVKLPWTYLNPTDFPPGEFTQFVKFLMDYEDENEQKTTTNDIEDKVIKSNIERIDSQKPNFRYYLQDALAFEKIVRDCLNEIVGVYFQTDQRNAADFYITTKKGLVIPIEVKFIQKPNMDIFRRLNELIKKNFEIYNTNHFIVIFPHEINSKEKSIISEGIKPEGIHFIFENEKDELKQKLKTVIENIQ
jgi:hypothetical protein